MPVIEIYCELSLPSCSTQPIEWFVSQGQLYPTVPIKRLGPIFFILLLLYLGLLQNNFTFLVVARVLACRLQQVYVSLQA